MEGRRKEGETTTRRRREAASLGASAQEWLQHVKASAVGAWRKATARSEQEAAEADMRAAKAQVEATDEAEARRSASPADRGRTLQVATTIQSVAFSIFNLLFVVLLPLCM
ncbi:hypothetical protein ZWY2020_006764 [Hordeum vulgare]|nr:hypothetical protein ZWY2020_006764 [Hordeum vulgare]